LGCREGFFARIGDPFVGPGLYWRRRSKLGGAILTKKLSFFFLFPLIYPPFGSMHPPPVPQKRSKSYFIAFCQVLNLSAEITISSVAAYWRPRFFARKNLTAALLRSAQTQPTET
jgi:hypothetical protein